MDVPRCIYNRVPGYLRLLSSRPPSSTTTTMPIALLSLLNTSAPSLEIRPSPRPKEIRLAGTKYVDFMDKESICFDDNKMFYKNRCKHMTSSHHHQHNVTNLKRIFPNIINNSSMLLSRNMSQYIFVRNYASRKKRQDNKQDHGEKESDEELLDDDSGSDFDEDDDDVDLLPKGWKDLVQVVPSLRLDTVLSSGLGIARKKVEDAFLESKLRVNNERVSKKSKMVKSGDVLDLIRHGDDKTNSTVMRVVVLKISSDKTSKDRIRVKLRRWKQLDLKINA